MKLFGNKLANRVVARSGRMEEFSFTLESGLKLAIRELKLANH